MSLACASLAGYSQSTSRLLKPRSARIWIALLAKAFRLLGVDASAAKLAE
jgi:hypothetical protein